MIYIGMFYFIELHWILFYWFFSAACVSVCAYVFLFNCIIIKIKKSNKN